MNKTQMQILLNYHELKIKELKAREELILDAIKKCFPSPACTDGFQVVPNYHYNNLVKIINS